jgi:dienelactone hydrolase
VELAMTAVRLLACCALCALMAGCGSSDAPHPHAAGSPRLTFGYDASAPIGYADRGRVNRRADPIAVDDVSFRSGRERVEGYLLLPPGRGRRPAVVLVHGTGGDRSELLEQARRLAARNVVALTITEPSTFSPPTRTAGGAAALLKQIQAAQVRDVVAIRRAVDVLQSLPRVDPKRIAYLGWSAGARTGTFVGASEPRVHALVLLSAGAAPISAYVAGAPPSLRRAVRQVLGSLDPIRYIALARPGSVLLEDGTKDETVPHAALLNIVHAAPRGTTVRWYDAPHALDQAAYRDAFDWLARKLAITR